MFRYTVIDVGGDLVVFNKEDGALAQTRRDSWPPRFPTEDEVKFERARLKTERLERQARLEEDVRRKRVQTINTVQYSKSDNNEDNEEQSSEDSGIVSFREEEHATLALQTSLGPTTEEHVADNLLSEEVKGEVSGELPSPTTYNTPSSPVPVTPALSEPDSRRSSRTSRPPSVRKARSVSVKSLRTQDAIPTDNVKEGPGDKPYIVAPGRRRAPKSKEKKSGCCTIL